LAPFTSIVAVAFALVMVSPTAPVSGLIITLLIGHTTAAKVIGNVSTALL
jgi:hypothetical protein